MEKQLQCGTFEPDGAAALAMSESPD